MMRLSLLDDAVQSEAACPRPSFGGEVFACVGGSSKSASRAVVAADVVSTSAESDVQKAPGELKNQADADVIPRSCLLIKYTRN